MWDKLDLPISPILKKGDKEMKKNIVSLFLFSLILSTNIIPTDKLVYGDNAHPGPTLQVTAIIEPCINITLSTDAIVFNCKGAPGVYDADQRVIVTVGSNCGNWTVKCSATPLKGDGGTIPSERMFMKTPDTPNVDKGAGGGFEPMSGEKLVLIGSSTERKETRLEFRLKTTWEDKAGTYTGQINYTYLATP